MSTLIVGDWGSRCACGEPADIAEPGHLTTPPTGLGCGAMWTGVQCDDGSCAATAATVVRLAAQLNVPITTDTTEEDTR